MNLEITTKQMPVLSSVEDVLGRCHAAKQLEMDGDYAGARAVLSDLCPELGARPEVSQFSKDVQAEVLLRAGALCGWLGGAHQIERSQERAKDLISESRGIFEQLALKEKTAEASNDLAICYWREGAFDEARATLRYALSQIDSEVNEVKLRTLLNLAVVERSSMRLKDALKINQEAAQAFKQCNNHSLLGKFHNEYATVLKNLGLAENREDYLDQALLEYAAAGFHLEQVGNKRFQGVTENNQGLLFSSIGRFAEAHEHLRRARNLFLSIGDRGSVAEVDETRARVMLAEGKFEEAERTVKGSVRTLMRGDQRSLLAEALTTHGTTLARLQRKDEARANLKRAVDVAERAGDPETAGIAALTMVEELGMYLGSEARQFYLRAELLLQKTQDRRILTRLGECARRLLSQDSLGPRSFEVPEPDVRSNSGQAEELKPYSLEERVLTYEGEIIKRALEAAGGSVTKASRLLGITHQGLAFILNGRHQNLLAARTPVKPRRRSIISRR